MTKLYSFFSHFNRVNMQRGLPKVWTIHFRDKCIQANEIDFRVPVKTRYIPNGPQPRATIRGRATEVNFNGNIAIVQ